jgi:hypothetical protein
MSNANFEVGDLVDYWTGAREGTPSGRGRIKSVSLLGGHTPVAWIDGARGCVALTHLRNVCEPKEHSYD